MELRRTNIDHAGLQTLEEMKKTKGKKFGLTNRYDVEITSDTARLLFEKIRFNLSLEEIISNSRNLAKYILRENILLSSRLRPIQARRKDTLFAKELIKTKTYQELGMNKILFGIRREDSKRLALFEFTTRLDSISYNNILNRSSNCRLRIFDYSNAIC